MAEDDTDASPTGAQPAESLLRTRLDPREQVLWTGRPVPGHAAWSGLPGTTWLGRGAFLALAVVAMAPFSLAGVYVAWNSAKAFLGFESIAAMLGSPLLFAFGMTLALAPWYLVLRPRLRNARDARDTWYLITDARVLVVLLGDGAVVDEYETDLRHVAAPRVAFERRDGVGDIVFTRAGADLSAPHDGLFREDASLVAVPAAREVLAILEGAIARCPAAGRDAAAGGS